MGESRKGYSSSKQRAMLVYRTRNQSTSPEQETNLNGDWPASTKDSSQAIDHLFQPTPESDPALIFPISPATSPGLFSLPEEQI